MYEEMGSFFDKRAESYDNHQLNNTDAADQYYKMTAQVLGLKGPKRLLDLGCGTGLELDEIYKLSPWISVTGIDLAPLMLASLLKKPYASRLNLINGSYFDVPFQKEAYDACVAVETLHHFPSSMKIELYRKIFAALRNDGVYVETDFIALDDEEEKALKEEWLEARAGVPDNVFLHIDRPHTVKHTIEYLTSAGFSDVKQVWARERTSIILAKKEVRK